MIGSRYLKPVVIILTSGIVFSVFLYSTGYALVSNAHGLYSMVQLKEMPILPILLSVWILLVASWLVYSSILVRGGYHPKLLVFQADARSYLILNLAILDTVRFFPGPWVALFPSGWDRLVTHRVIVGVFLFFALNWVKLKQRRAIQAGAPDPKRKFPLITYWIAAFIPVSLVAGGIGLSAGNPGSPIRQTELLDLDRWLKAQAFHTPQSPSQEIALPRGIYEITGLGPEEKIQVSAPVLPKPMVCSPGNARFEIPVDTNHVILSCVAPGMPDASIKHVSFPEMPSGLASIFPERVDSRFHEIKLDTPFPCYMYLLDTHTFQPERTGVWIRGNSTTRFILMTYHDMDFMEFHIHSLKDNNVAVQQAQCIQSLALKKNEMQTVSFQPMESFHAGELYFYEFQVRVDSGLYLSEVTPNSSDTRFLGAFLGWSQPGMGDWTEMASGSDRSAWRLWKDVLNHTEDIRLIPWRDYAGWHLSGGLHPFIPTASQPDSPAPIMKLFPKQASQALVRRILQRFDVVRVLPDLGFWRGVAPDFPPEYRSAENIRQWEDVIFNESVELKRSSFTVEQESRVLRIAMVWGSRKKITDNLVVMIHIVPENDSLVSRTIRKLTRKFRHSLSEVNGDHAFLNGSWPTWKWTVGEDVRDLFEITLPDELKSGDYEIRVGLYNGADRKKWETTHGRDWCVIGRLRR